jgi:hypothetical protein
VINEYGAVGGKLIKAKGFTIIVDMCWHHLTANSSYDNSTDQEVLLD